METMERTAIPPMTAHDRCDHGGCESQAYLAVQMREGSGVLRFCGHHGRKVLPAILAQEPFDIRDDIALLRAPAGPAPETVNR